MIEIKDRKALEILNKKFNFTFNDNDIFTPGFAIIANKGYGSTSFLFPNFPGTQYIFSYDGQTNVILHEMAKRDPTLLDRVIVRDLYSPIFKEMGSGDKALLEAGYNISKYVLESLPLLSGVDHIVHERLPVLNRRIEMYARYKFFGDYEESVTEAATGSNMRMWELRNNFYDQMIALTFAHSDICPVVTTYPSKDFNNAFKGQKIETPEWQTTVMAHFRNVINIKRIRDTKKPKGFAYYAVLDSMKGTDFGETGDEIDITGYKTIFPPEKFERYRKNNPFSEVKNPMGETKVPHLKGDESYKKDIDTAKENLNHVLDEKQDDLLGDI